MLKTKPGLHGKATLLTVVLLSCVFSVPQIILGFSVAAPAAVLEDEAEIPDLSDRLSIDIDLPEDRFRFSYKVTQTTAGNHFTAEISLATEEGASLTLPVQGFIKGEQYGPAHTYWGSLQLMDESLICFANQNSVQFYDADSLQPQSMPLALQNLPEPTGEFYGLAYEEQLGYLLSAYLDEDTILLHSFSPWGQYQSSIKVPARRYWLTSSERIVDSFAPDEYGWHNGEKAVRFPRGYDSPFYYLFESRKWVTRTPVFDVEKGGRRFVLEAENDLAFYNQRHTQYVAEYYEGDGLVSTLRFTGVNLNPIYVDEPQGDTMYGRNWANWEDVLDISPDYPSLQASVLFNAEYSDKDPRATAELYLNFALGRGGIHLRFGPFPPLEEEEREWFPAWQTSPSGRFTIRDTAWGGAGDGNWYYLALVDNQTGRSVYLATSNHGNETGRMTFLEDDTLVYASQPDRLEFINPLSGETWRTIRLQVPKEVTGIPLNSVYDPASGRCAMISSLAHRDTIDYIRVDWFAGDGTHIGGHVTDWQMHRGNMYYYASPASLMLLEQGVVYLDIIYKDGGEEWAYAIDMETGEILLDEGYRWE